MRKLFVFCIFFHFAACSAFAQDKIDSAANQKLAPVEPAPQRTAPRQNAPRQGSPQQELPPITTPQQELPPITTPQQGATQQAAPKPDPFLDEATPAPLDDLNLDSNQSFNFDDSANTPSSNASNFQSSIASNSNFRGASPQMIGDFGGGSSILTLGAGVGADPANNVGALSNMLTTPIALAGGSRRIKVAENNQVMPMDRWYTTFNYFHNSYPAVGTEGFDYTYPVNVVDSASLVQYTIGAEKKFCVGGTPFSVDVRMPFTGGVDQSVRNFQGQSAPSSFSMETGKMGNLSLTLKAYLLQYKQTSISGGLGISLPTGSAVNIGAFEVVNQEAFGYSINIDNNALHLMPFLGAYRPIGDSYWLQAFTQIDTSTNGNDVRTTRVRTDLAGNLLGLDESRLRLNEQTLLYADVSFGKWWYRDNCQCGQRHGLTGVASVLELHYTSSLNDADTLNLGGIPRVGVDNRFDMLNLTTGLQLEFNNSWRMNVAGVFPLREGRFDDSGRQEDRGFDGEFSLQINRLF
jgi:hypothetical protein